MAIQGQVKWFDPKKGYGFIIGPEGQDVFVHYSQIQEEGFRLLKDGEVVTYEPVESEKGFQARAVYRTGGRRSKGSEQTSPNSAASSHDPAPSTSAGASESRSAARFNGHGDS